MKFKYQISNDLSEKVSKMEEFANGGTQVTIVTKDGGIYHKILISNNKYIVAMRGCEDLPFDVADIESIYQSDEDKNPNEKGGWKFWDEW